MRSAFSRATSCPRECRRYCAPEESNGSHLATVRVRLHERPTRQVSPAEIEESWRRNLGALPPLERMVFQTTSVRPRPTVAYVLKHEDADALEGAAAELRFFLATIPGVYEIADSLRLGKRHLEIRAHPGRPGGGIESGRDRHAVAGQLSWHGGPADSARP